MHVRLSSAGTFVYSAVVLSTTKKASKDLRSGTNESERNKHEQTSPKPFPNNDVHEIDHEGWKHELDAGNMAWELDSIPRPQELAETSCANDRGQLNRQDNLESVK